MYLIHALFLQRGNSSLPLETAKGLNAIRLPMISTRAIDKASQQPRMTYMWEERSRRLDSRDANKGNSTRGFFYQSTHHAPATLSASTSMAVVSQPALSAEWSFPSSVNPYDAPAFGPHIELADHTAVHQLQVANKRRAHELEWDDEDSGERLDSSLKKSKKSMSRTVDPHQLHGENPAQGVPPAAPPPHIEQVISILVDALTSSGPTPPMMALGCLPEPPITVLSSTVPSSFPIPRTVPTSPLSNCPNRAPFVRKTIGGSCAGKSEASLCRWVLCKNHFLR